MKDLPDLSKKPTHPKKAKKAKKKAAKPKPAEPAYRILAQVEITPAIEEILVSDEAKLYLRGIDRASNKLQAMIQRELALLRHPAHPDHPGSS